MIRKALLVLFISACALSNDADSLFWYDVGKFDSLLPNFPIVINKIFTGKDLDLIDSLKKNENNNLEIFRIQIFESTVASIARAEAKRFQNIIGDTVYIDFETPLYKLRIGNYKNRKSAEKAIDSIYRLGAKDAWIIRTKIRD